MLWPTYSWVLPLHSRYLAFHLKTWQHVKNWATENSKKKKKKILVITTAVILVTCISGDIHFFKYILYIICNVSYGISALTATRSKVYGRDLTASKYLFSLSALGIQPPFYSGRHCTFCPSCPLEYEYITVAPAVNLHHKVISENGSHALRIWEQREGNLAPWFFVCEAAIPALNCLLGSRLSVCLTIIKRSLPAGELNS